MKFACNIIAYCGHARCGYVHMTVAVGFQDALVGIVFGLVGNEHMDAIHGYLIFAKNCQGLIA